MKRFGHYFALFCYLLIITNILYIDLFILTKKDSDPNTIFRSENPQVEKKLSDQIITEESSVLCDAACISKIYASIENATKSALKAIPKNSNTIQNTSTVKEFFIPFGSGFSSAEEWTDVPGMSATIDTNNYKKIKTVFFEASLRIPTGNQKAYARLFNITDKHPVWFSEVSIEGGTPTLVTSQPITLDEGNNVYQVQMKTSLKYQSFIDQARIKITIQ